MVLPSRRRESSTLRLCTSALVAALIAAAPPSSAGTGETITDLRPYTARYQTKFLGLKVDLTRILRRGPDDTYTLTSAGELLVAGIHEVSVFHTEGSQVIPKSYVYQVTGLVNRRREVHFTPGSDAIRSLYKGQWYNLPYSNNALDRMSQQEQLRLLLLNDPTPRKDVLIRIADGKRVKDYRLVYVGEETIDTTAGRIDTLHFKRIHDDPDRKSDTWVAPALDYLMVKTIHVEGGRPTEVLLTGGSIDGEPIAAQ